MMKSDFGWNTLLYEYSDRLLKFVLNAQTNTLPTPDNLRRWGLKRNVACGLCGRKEVTLAHVLGGCEWVRQTEHNLDREDRYTWRHNNILHLLSLAIKEHLGVVCKLPERKTTDPLIRFVRAGAGVRKQSAPLLKGILSQARDWECDFDLPDSRPPLSKYRFPSEVCATPLRMDGFILSRTRRICVGIELTVPMEHNIANWHQTKLQKYETRLDWKQNGTRGSFTAAWWKLGLEVGFHLAWARRFINWVFPRLVNCLIVSVCSL